MKITEDQKEEIIGKLEKLYMDQITIPINSIKIGYAEAIAVVPRELSTRLSKYGQADTLDVTHYIDVPYLCKGDRGCRVRFYLNPNTDSYIYVDFDFGEVGIQCHLRAYVSRGGCVCFSDEISVKKVILAACGCNNYTTIREFVNDRYETKPENIVSFKRFLEHGFGELFEEMAKAADMFAKMVSERSNACDELEEKNTMVLLEEFGMKGSSERRKYTRFEVHIIKTEIEE